MIVAFPLVAFAIGLGIAYRSPGRWRHGATLLMLGAVAWALALLINPAAVFWAVGPVLATVLVPPAAERLPCSFEVLTRRTLTIAGLMLLALFLALRFPVGENPVLLTVVPWALGALGAAWMLRPIDERERLQGQVLMVSATGAVVLVAIPAGAVSAGVVGAMALVPWLGQRVMAGSRPPVLISSLMIGLAGLAGILAVTGLVISRQTIADLPLLFSGPLLFGVAVVLLGGALTAPPGSAWSGLLAALALIAGTPALRWSAIAAVISLATLTDRDGERPAWVALAGLAGVAVLQGLTPAPLSPRFQTVALGVGLLMAVYAFRHGLLRAVALPAVGFLVLSASLSLGSGDLTRFQWLVAAGGLVLLGRALLLTARSVGHPSLGTALTAALFLLAIGAHDPLSLGALASALLLIDLAIVPGSAAVEEENQVIGRLTALARSSWPPSVRFAGASLAVVAALQASLVLGLMAALMLALLQFAPLLDLTTRQRPIERPHSRLRWLVPAVSLACGVGPAVVLRMLRV